MALYFGTCLGMSCKKRNQWAQYIQISSHQVRTSTSHCAHCFMSEVCTRLGTHHDKKQVHGHSTFSICQSHGSVWVLMDVSRFYKAHRSNGCQNRWSDSPAQSAVLSHPNVGSKLCMKNGSTRFQDLAVPKTHSHQFKYC